jgi:nucleoside-diphosphate-sugar epimerase
VEQGHDVVGLDNLNDYYDVRLKRHRLDRLASPRFAFHELDIENQEGLWQLFADHRFEAVLHLAARAGVRYSVENPYVYFSTNVQGNLNLLELVRHHQVPKFVLASTSSLYAGQPTPFVETLPVNEPISPYAASKKAAEVTSYTYHRLFGVDVTVLRFFTVYGPAGRPDMAIFRFVRGIASGTPIPLLGDGHQSRDFTYIDDIAHGVIAALRPTGYQIINLGGGRQPTTMRQLIQQLEELLQRKAIIQSHPAHAADLTETWADISKAQSILNWRPVTGLTEGLQATVDWFRANEALARSIA